MAYLNRSEIIGNTGKPATIVHLQSGSTKVSLSVAVTKKYRDKNGEQKEQTNWFNVVAFGKLAETIEKLAIQKGACVFVAGEMNFRNYTDQDGNARSIAELNADSIQLLTPRNSIAAGTPYASQPEQQQGEPADNFEGDDDLPF